MMPTARRHVVIVSHDCDFNKGNRQYFLVAKLIDLSRDQKIPETLEHMTTGNDARARTVDGKPIGLNMFIIDPVPDVLEEHMIASFELIMPVAVGFREALFKRKVAEMADDHRKLLRAKLAYFVGRPEDDISDDLKVPKPNDPSTQVWKEIPAPR
jgi:hypothetical protein